MASWSPIFVVFFLISPCKSDDRVTPSKPLSYGDVLVSNGGDFALGFFSPAGSDNRSSYLGIWYNSIPVRTVVWVANRDSPITAPSSASLAVANGSAGIVLSDHTTGGAALWAVESNITGAAASAVLLNTGNLVLRLANGTDVWQSFDHPTDTVLPSMRFVVSYKDRIVGRVVAWKSPGDPSSGDFSCSGDPASPGLQIVTWNKTAPYCRVNVWSDLSVSGGTFQNNTNSIIYQTAVGQEEEFYFVFTVSDGMPFKRITLDHTGALSVLSWDRRSSAWAVINQHPTVACEVYAACGPFSYCNVNGGVPACRCLDGFEPVDGGGASSASSSEGCRRKDAMECGGRSQFVPLSDMKVPDKFSHLQNRSFGECADECSRSCSCTAYAYANMTNGGSMADLSRCLLWTGDLVDAGSYGRYGENLYIRLADTSVHRKSNSLQIILPIAGCLLLLTITAIIIWTCKCRAAKKKKIQKNRMVGYLSASNELESEDLKFPFVGFEEILHATDHFSDSNLLGMGGFGKVYKGTLQGGKEVAVKRLSKDSGQGTEQFKNEVVLIAKLQHKNLVRLLACCIHQDEKLLIYEYLPNKSLDVFLFDAARKHVLDWSTRFKIIKGVVRGLLYLHQDSRLTIIHRDLKASNILLDAEMDPKISDFGMARIFGGNQQQANTNRVVGTYGYMSPEYAMGGAFSVKSDTYSFGILLLEIVSGLKINSPQLPTNPCNLIAYAWRLWEDGNAAELVDSSAVAGDDESCRLREALRCIHVGLLCVQGSPADRPLMSRVIFMLENEGAPLAPPKQPVFFSARGGETADDTSENSANAMSFTAVEGR